MTERGLTITRGDDKAYQFTFKTATGPVNLTNCQVMFTAKRSTADSDEKAVISVTQAEITDPASGVATINLSNSDTKITPGVYHYDVQLVTAGDKIYTVLKGKLLITYEVTERGRISNG